MMQPSCGFSARLEFLKLIHDGQFYQLNFGHQQLLQLPNVFFPIPRIKKSTQDFTIQIKRRKKEALSWKSKISINSLLREALKYNSDSFIPTALEK